LIPGKTKELYFQGPQSLKVFSRLWTSDERAEGTVLGVHGYSEHSGCYHQFAEFLNINCLNFFMLDLPGHGRSDGDRSCIDNFETYVETFDRFVLEAKERSLPEPYFVFGHSLGGLVAIRYLQTWPEAQRIKKVILSSPLLGLSTKCFHGAGHLLQTSWSRKSVGFVLRLLPNWVIQNENQFGAQILTHDLQVARRRRADPLIRPQVSLRWTSEFFGAVERAFEDAPLVRAPFAVFQAAEDYVTCAESAEDFVRRISSAEKLFRSYPGFYHEILNEIDRVQVMEEMLHWLRLDSVESRRETGSI